MTIVAFDAKKFSRGRPKQGPGKADRSKVFETHLGIGVIIDEPDAFVRAYLDTSRDLARSFGIDRDIPFFSSTFLKNNLGISRATSFSDQLVSSIQEHVASVHCSYVILPPSKISVVSVGGLQCPTIDMPGSKFIDNLGPMFSYLTAHSYLWMKQYRDLDNMDLHIDSFRSRHTRSWSMITDAATPKIFTRGDECNPFISCADIVAFLTDAKLYSKRLKLNPSNLKKVWNDYTFDVTVQFFDQKNLGYYTWNENSLVDTSKYLARPVIFLSIDDIELAEPPADDPEQQDMSPNKPRKFNRFIKDSPVYYATLKYAYQNNGCLKIFSKTEDMSLVRDGDVFVHVGTDSEKIGKSLLQAFDIRVFSGLEIRKNVLTY